MRTLVIFFVVFVAACEALWGQQCVHAPYEYCQVGCESLGPFVAVPADSLGEVMDIALELDPIERAAMQVTRQRDTFTEFVVVYRRLLSRSPVVSPWLVEEHSSIESAAHSPHLVGALAKIVETNDPDHQFLVIWRDPCVQPRRRRGVR